MNLFVYGTLLFPEIRNLIGGRNFEGQAASITGFQIFRVKDANYPGIVKTAHGVIKGQVLCDITEEEMERFDNYEGDLYLRTSNEVQLKNSPQLVAACLYEIPESLALDLLSDQEWSEEWFEEFHYPEFLVQLKKSYY